MRKRSIEDVFRKLIPIPESGCWIWEGCTARGYGVSFKFNGTTRVHKIIYEWTHGPVPEGKVLDHLCRVRCCANPDHLEVVTAVENTLRGSGITAINKQKRHCKHGHELTNENVRLVKGGRSCKQCERDKYPTSNKRRREMRLLSKGGK